MNLWCVARRHRDGEWEAFCLDFDLAVQGQTYDEVVGLLREAIAAYIETANHEAEPARQKLLARHAPFTNKLLWRLRVGLWNLFGPKRAVNVFPSLKGRGFPQQEGDVPPRAQDGFKAALVSRSCDFPQPSHTQALIRRPAIPLGPLHASHAEQVWVVLYSATSVYVAPCAIAL
jgi:predicted RNase H-like HicB family nuclease